jgi:DNA-binding transcriptional LysR family regulator
VDLLAQMATFVRVVEGSSLSAAARAQRLSLPAVSRQIRALETELGATLIVRSTRQLRVTDAGRRWYERCVRILRDVDEARDEVRSTKVVRGSLVISAPFTLGPPLLVPCLTKLVEKHPQLSVDLRLEDRLVDLVGEGVDVAVRGGAPPPDSTAYVAHPIFSMTRILVASPRSLRRHGTPRSVAELARKPCLVQVTPRGTVVRWELSRGAEEQTIEVRGALRTNTPSALRDFAVEGAGVAYVPDWLVATDIAEGRLKRVLPQWSSRSLYAWAVHRTELRGSPRLRALLEALPKSVNA